MGDTKRPMNRISYKVRAKGSLELANKLMKGDFKRIAEGLGFHLTTVMNVVRGKQFGDSRIVECAEQLVAFYQSLDIEFNVKTIIENHAATNKD